MGDQGLRDGEELTSEQVNRQKISSNKFQKSAKSEKNRQIRNVSLTFKMV